MLDAYKLHAVSEVKVNVNLLTPWAFLRSPQSGIIKELAKNMVVCICVRYVFIRRRTPTEIPL